MPHPFTKRLVVFDLRWATRLKARSSRSGHKNGDRGELQSLMIMDRDLWLEHDAFIGRLEHFLAHRLGRDGMLDLVGLASGTS